MYLAFFKLSARTLATARFSVLFFIILIKKMIMIFVLRLLRFFLYVLLLTKLNRLYGNIVEANDGSQIFFSFFVSSVKWHEKSTQLPFLLPYFYAVASGRLKKVKKNKKKIRNVWQAIQPGQKKRADQFITCKLCVGVIFMKAFITFELLFTRY